MNTFKYTVKIPYNKDQYDREMFNFDAPNGKRIDWLYKNIGKSDLFIPEFGHDEGEGVWSSDIEYKPKFTITYSFKHEKDAALFALKWL
jgi:hypothetical protein